MGESIWGAHRARVIAVNPQAIIPVAEARAPGAEAAVRHVDVHRHLKVDVLLLRADVRRRHAEGETPTGHPMEVSTSEGTGTTDTPPMGRVVVPLVLLVAAAVVGNSRCARLERTRGSRVLAAVQSGRM